MLRLHCLQALHLALCHLERISSEASVGDLHGELLDLVELCRARAVIKSVETSRRVLALVALHLLLPAEDWPGNAGVSPPRGPLALRLRPKQQEHVLQALPHVDGLEHFLALLERGGPQGRADRVCQPGGGPRPPSLLLATGRRELQEVLLHAQGQAAHSDPLNLRARLREQPHRGQVKTGHPRGAQHLEAEAALEHEPHAGCCSAECAALPHGVRGRNPAEGSNLVELASAGPLRYEPNPSSAALPQDPPRRQELPAGQLHEGADPREHDAVA
mmetsp:Transcript_15276/g.43712  ORF Transcript_15276/g.43712 Transcript_15276/m.43712 type:complete len:274 (-) Transcript_15276:45-866(-)